MLFVSGVWICPLYLLSVSAYVYVYVYVDVYVYVYVYVDVNININKQRITHAGFTSESWISGFPLGWDPILLEYLSMNIQKRK